MAIAGELHSIINLKVSLYTHFCTPTLPVIYTINNFAAIHVFHLATRFKFDFEEVEI